MGRRRCKDLHNGCSVSRVGGLADNNIDIFTYKIIQGNAICVLQLTTHGAVCIDGKFNVFLAKVGNKGDNPKASFGA